MNRRVFLWLLGAGSLLSAGCDNPDRRLGFATHFPAAARVVREARSVTLYEGLPAPWDGATYRQELADKKTIQVHKYPFYERPLPLAAEEIAVLRRLCTDPGSYRAHTEKMCMAFHPDYCLVWDDHQVLVCFGCEEIRIAGPGGTIAMDLEPDACERFKAILETHRDQRPAQHGWSPSKIDFLTLVYGEREAAQRRRPDTRDRAAFAPLADSLRRAHSITLYEGLPHAFSQESLFRRERKKKRTISIQEFPFYARPLPLPPGETEALRRVCADVNGYNHFFPHRAGFFHPDYCLAWNDDGRAYRMLVCLSGKATVRLYGPDSALTLDIHPDAYSGFVAALRKHHAQRPTYAFKYLDTIQESAFLSLWEGLPHPTDEADLFARERAGKKTFLLYEQLYYDPPATVAASEIEGLRRLCSDEGNFIPCDNATPRTPFHADYCVTWKSASAVYQVIVDFGCNEVHIYGPAAWSQMVMRPETVKRFRAALARYRRQRPR